MPAVPNSPPSTESSAGRSPDVQHRVVRKRNRIPLSCAPCRVRKLRCNRSHPCDNCVKRGDTSSCTYATTGNRRRNTGDSTGSPDQMQDRINRLESLVLSLMTNGAPAAAPGAAAAAMGSRQNSTPADGQSPLSTTESSRAADEDSEVEQMSRDVGLMKVWNDTQTFASDAHWFTILHDIAEVKAFITDHKKQMETQAEIVKASKQASTGDDIIGAGMLFRGAATMTREEVVANFPPKKIANQLISRYFETENPSAHIIHRPSFVRQYETYWQDPDSASTIWLGICYGMMCLALQSYHRAGDEPMELRDKSWQQSLQYLNIVSQCLNIADWTQPKIFVIEALCLYLQAEQARSRDAETGIWILVGILVKLGMRMGLHRDSKLYTTITPYQGEMRRRLWNFIRSYDVLCSFQLGLPVTIKSYDSDTTLPNNIFDEEFDEDSRSLPPSRPLTESTPMSFMIINCHYTFVLGKIIEGSSAITPHSYEDAMKLDADLREIRGGIPPNLRLKTRHDSLDSASIIMQRYTLELLYHKSMMSLHRKFLVRAREQPRFSYSRRACVEACLEMLKNQVMINQECQPGGRLRTLQWSVTTSITIHDFLLASVIVCLDLYHQATAEAKGKQDDANHSWAVEHQEEMLVAVERAIGIWDSMANTSMEAFKAGNMLRVMRNKVRTLQGATQQSSNSSYSFSSGNSPNGVSLDNQVAPEHSAAMTLGMMASGGMTPDGLGNKGFMPPARTGFTPQPMMNNGNSVGDQLGDGMNFSSLFGSTTGFQGFDVEPQNLDWDIFDTYVQGQNLDNVGGNMSLDPLLDGFNATGSPYNNTTGSPPDGSASTPSNKLSPTASGSSQGMIPPFTSIWAPGGQAYNPGS